MTIKNLHFRHHIFPVLSALIFILSAASCVGSKNAEGGFSAKELELINDADTIMRVLTIENPSDEAVLRAKSVDLSVEALLSDEFRRLAELMVATVTHPSQDGVGIAGPQVGLNRRVVAVQRFDKEPVEENGRAGHPFEVYPNVRIVWASDSLSAGPEGCLSVPDRRGNVLRSQRIIIEYVDMEALKGRGAINGNVCQATGRGTEDEAEASGKADEAEASGKAAFPMVSDTVCGFTAVIFQHEIDHLDGVLYIDRL